jgi:predicted nucleic acid-binding protein
MILVLDASVVAKWFFEELDSDKARDILVGCGKGQIRPLAPEILPAEIANSLSKRVMRGALGAEEALAQYARFERLCPSLVSISSLADLALRIALANRHAVYDCLYVALATRMRCDLFTADERLYNTFSTAIPAVKLLRDWA